MEWLLQHSQAKKNMIPANVVFPGSISEIASPVVIFPENLHGLQGRVSSLAGYIRAAHPIVCQIINRCIVLCEDFKLELDFPVGIQKQW